MIRRGDQRDFESTWSITNDGAQAYRGVIPADRWADPYMPREKLRHEIDAGVPRALSGARSISGYNPGRAQLKHCT
jgi:hypothetical protein